MNGDYFGYDGPCPPWNDERVHHYVHAVRAGCPLAEPVRVVHRPDALKAMQGHVLAQASLTGTYTLNPDLAPRQIGATTSS